MLIRNRALPIALLVAGVWWAAGCTSETAGGAADPPAAPADAVATGGGGADVVTPPPDKPEPLTCATKPAGALRTSEGDIIYQNQTVDVVASHGDSGCMVGLDITWSIGGQCALSVTLAEAAGGWELSAATFAAGSECGEFWPADFAGEYTLDVGASAAAVVQAPVVAEGAAEACVDGKGITLIGKLSFDGAGGRLDTYLDALGVGGEVHSALVAGAACPAAPQQCSGLECGEDSWGTACGDCGTGMACQEGACVASPCPPKPPFGTTQDTTMTDVVLMDCDGNEVSFHDMCGAKAGYVNLFAAW